MPKPTLTVYSRTLYAQPWTLNIALLRYQVRICEIRLAADKRRYNVLSICPVAHPFTLAGFGVFDVAKLQLFPDIERKNPASQKASRNKGEETMATLYTAYSVFTPLFFVL